MNAREVLDALHSRFPPDAYLTIREAPQNSGRGGRKLDAVVVSLWKSRGLEMDGIEVKVSVRDWRRELKEPDKAEWWFHHVNRFWVAVPADIAGKVIEELPEGWGLLSVSEKGNVRARVNAVRHDRTPLDWGQTVGLLRATADAGITALQMEYQRGLREGRETAPASVEYRESLDSRNLEELREKVRTFTEITGLHLTGYPDTLRTQWAAFQAYRSLSRDPVVTARNLRTIAAQLTAGADLLNPDEEVSGD